MFARFIVASAAIVAPLAFAADSQISCRVVGVTDGDTITCLTSERVQVKIRLAQIDAPEKSQDYGMASKQSLSDIIYGQNVRADCETTDRYGRQVCTVWKAQIDVNLEQVRRGMAWVYRKYAHDPAYYRAENEARIARRGLWSARDPVPPWEFRRRK